MKNKDRILEMSKKLGLTHIGSNISCLSVIEEVYAKKKLEDIVILDNGHAHLSHLLVKHETLVQPSVFHYVLNLIKEYGIHCDRKAGCDASGGSLGHGLGIGIGYAFADPKREVYVLVSDGSMQEGSNWESLRIAESLHLRNLHIYCNFNGFSAVASLDLPDLKGKMRMFYSGDLQFRDTKNGEGFEGVQGHYKKL